MNNATTGLNEPTNWWTVRIVQLKPNLDEYQVMAFRVWGTNEQAWETGYDLWHAWARANPGEPSTMSLSLAQRTY